MSMGSCVPVVWRVDGRLGAVVRLGGLGFVGEGRWEFEYVSAG